MRATLPSDLVLIVQQLRMRFRGWVEEDIDCEEIPDFLAAEELVMDLVREAGLGMLQEYVDMRAEQALSHRLPCKCGVLKEVNRHPSWPRKTLLGTVHVRDTYTYCRVCQQSGKPVQAWIGTDRDTWSLPVQEAAVDLATDESCAKAIAKLQRHHPGVEMGRTTALRLRHKHGAKARKFIDAKLAGARGLTGEPTAKQGGQAAELEVQYDGGMIPVATLEPIEPEEGKEPELTPVRGLPKQRKVCRYEEVKAGLVQKPGEVKRLYTLRPTGGLQEEAGRSKEVVTELRQAWVASGDDEESRNDTLRLKANYFERNGDAVASGDDRERGWSTASSEIESCHGTIVQPRLKIGGAWWHPDKVDDILALRMLKANGWWEDYWTDQRQQWRHRAAILAEARPSLSA